MPGEASKRQGEVADGEEFNRTAKAGLVLRNQSVATLNAPE